VRIASALIRQFEIKVGGESSLFTPDSFRHLKVSKQREVLGKLRVAGDVKMEPF
jgi:hypothetical protein